MVRLPRVVVAAAGSGHGKTTVATGLMAALRRRGLVVSGHKVGPDFIDPGYHQLATGRPGRNLDPFMVGEGRITPLLLHGASGAAIAVIEGVMGLFDGQLGTNGFASTAHVATLTRSPVVLVVDASHASRTVGAVVHGLCTFDPTVRIAGAIVNKVASPRHRREVLAALEPVGLPVLGVLPRDPGIIAPSRHLGLVPAPERPGAVAQLDLLAERIEECVDLDQFIELASAATDLDDEPWNPAAEVRPAGTSRPVVAVAGGRAFTFRYAEVDELLGAAGCEVVTFDPLLDDRLPDGTSALYLGGGFPETYVAQLASNRALVAQVGAAVAAGMPTIAECAGLLYLCRSLDERPMVGAVPADAAMTPRLTLGYRTAVVATDQLCGPEGTRVTGHEFHRTALTPAVGPSPAFLSEGRSEGFATSTLSASYLHLHWAGLPAVAQRFSDAAHAFDPSLRPLPTSIPRPAVTPTPIEDPLQHHGDQELAPGLLDLAVNVHPAGPPVWLVEAVRDSVRGVGAYPRAAPVEEALARFHGRDRGEVLVTNGAAEAFTLLARARPWQRPVVVHPQFTEPEAALRAAGFDPDLVFCQAEDDFALVRPRDLGQGADLVLLGNPTNPTGVVHPVSSIRALLAPGRVVVVDEAFMDFLDGEPVSLVRDAQDGLVVVRSLTKLWSIPGVRAGYVVGPEDVLADLRAQQPPWSVSAAALAAMDAVARGVGRMEQARRARSVAEDRSRLTAGLDRLGVRHVEGAGAFVLAAVPPGTHARLRAAGIAVRRCDTFPGLDDGWIRVAVRPAPDTDVLLTALEALQERAS